MFSALPTARQEQAPHGAPEAEHPDTIETRLWLEEHEWLYGLLRSERQRLADLPLPGPDQRLRVAGVPARRRAARIFDFLGTQLVLRPPLTPRRRESMWRPQYELLLAVQRSPANRHPNPKFQLDQLTTACVALCRQHEGADTLVLRQARLNMADRSARWRLPRAD
jgi:hypothetical protein